MFKKRLEAEQALAPLKNGIDDGKMGSLDVYPDFLKILEDVKGNCIYLNQELYKGPNPFIRLFYNGERIKEQYSTRRINLWHVSKMN